MNQEEVDEKYMRRCLQIARNGLLTAKPNPSVGAVIVSKDGHIIGEGYTSAYGGPHAEVNAFASVRPSDESLLKESTLYVSLEPCSHWGHTPPCCDLIIRKGISRCVCGCVDPFAKVRGRGIQRMREAGISVTVGVLETECWEANKRFMVYQTYHRPYVLLKWAQSLDGFIDEHTHPTMFSTPFTQMLSHQLRAESDAILVGRVTDEREHPQLNVRHWSGKDPKRMVLTHDTPLPDLMDQLYEDKVQSLIVEGGATTHQSFLDAGFWDEIRVETAPRVVGGGTKAVQLPSCLHLMSHQVVDGNSIDTYQRVR